MTRLRRLLRPLSLESFSPSLPFRCKSLRHDMENRVSEREGEIFPWASCTKCVADREANMCVVTAGIPSVEPQNVKAVEPSMIFQDYDDEEIFDPDLFRRTAPRNYELEIFEDLEARYSEKPISQADFFKPEGLSGDSEQPTKTKSVDPLPDESVPIRPDLPEIRISKPDEGSDTSSAGGQRPDSIGTSCTSVTSDSAQERREHNTEKAPRRTIDEIQTSLTSLGRRHSASGYISGPDENIDSDTWKIPRPWVVDERGSRTGWGKVRTRRFDGYSIKPSVDVVVVYLFNSEVCDKTKDPDADLDLFRCDTGVNVEKSTMVPEVKILRAQTDISTQAADRTGPASVLRPDHVSPTSTSDGPRNASRRQGDWMRDPSMLQKHLGDCRVLTFGFDISAAASGADSHEVAAAQLTEYLRDARKVHKPPIVFLGHTVGGLIIFRSLMHTSEQHNGDGRLQLHTAGVLLVSCPIIPAKGHAQEVAKSLAMDSSAKLERIFYESTVAITLPLLLRSNVFSMKSNDAKSLVDIPHTPIAPSRRREILIGFPIVQMLVPGEAMAGDLRRFNSAQVEVVLLMKKKIIDALRFSSPTETGFQRVIGTMKMFLLKRRMFLATAAGSVEQVGTLLQDGMDPNIGDRW